MDTPLIAMAQLMSTKVTRTVLLRFLVFVAYEHVMLQVHSWFCDMATKHRDNRGNGPRRAVNTCPWDHLFVDSGVRGLECISIALIVRVPS